MFKVVSLACVLCVQFFIALPRPGNLAKEPYRREERAAALKVMADNPTPANKAAFQEELRRDMHYINRRDWTRAGFVLAGFLLLDGLVILGIHKCRIELANNSIKG